MPRAPGGFWSWEDNGTYDIWLLGNQISDNHGNFIPEQKLGSFVVSIPDPNQGLTPNFDTEDPNDPGNPAASGV